MKTHVQESKASFFVNFHMRFDTGFKKLLEFCNAGQYGTPALISIVGGAKCISTNGIHWIDFSNQLIGSKWDKINASISSKLINPRSRDLNFLENSYSC
jgi:predicted dehydrogenase